MKASPALSRGSLHSLCTNSVRLSCLSTLAVRRGLVRPQPQVMQATRPTDPSQNSNIDDAALLSMLKDAHCHPQLDKVHLGFVGTLKVCKCVAMGVSEEDWSRVQAVHQQFPDKVIPAFGVHPWWSHLHASQAEQTLESILESKDQEITAQAIQTLQAEGSSGVSSSWEAHLKACLQSYPKAIVGEIGLDRAAVIPGTKAKTSFQHQMALFIKQLDIAAAYQRPVSIHCVRAYGHLLHAFLDRPPEQCPPKVMMHSYGGSVDDIKKLLKVKHVGGRFYFGFSSVINGKQREKLMERIQAVPDDRLLLESDHVEVLRIDDGMLEICGTVAEAKGWPLAHTAEVTCNNFDAFYAASL